MIERKDPDRFISPGNDDFDAERFADQDVKIRSGLCPNGHGLMAQNSDTQQCEKCGFFTNCLPEKAIAN